MRNFAAQTRTLTRAAEEPAGEQAPDVREPLPEEPLYTVKIDGQERQVPLSELTASYQIQSAAANRLDQANEVLRRARDMEQDVQGHPTATAPAVQPQPRDGLDGIDFAGLAERLQYGDTDAAAAALKETVTQIVETGGGAPAGPMPTRNRSKQGSSRRSNGPRPSIALARTIRIS